MFNSIYAGRSALVTGHTGFKGSWLRLWLEQLGAKVSGYALAPSTSPNHSDLLSFSSASTIGNICDADALGAHFEAHQPEIVFHLAAQASVLYSYDHPIETFNTNVVGTAQVLEACRRTSSVRAVVVVTTDKCYENREWLWGYRENDALGGHDPYSASKACAELVAASYRRSFTALSDPRPFHPLLIATARGGNVIGGGDWTADRLIPDAMRAAARGDAVRIRNPQSSRPWQHVLDLSAGYLLLGQRLLEGHAESAEPWNFGPDVESNLSSAALIARLQQVWPAVRAEILPRPSDPHEAGLLMLDSSKARKLLHWKPVWDIERALEYTAAWYRALFERHEVLSSSQIEQFSEHAVQQNVVWAR